VSVRALPDLLAASAARHGASDAVVMDGQRLDYAALETRASQFAHSLAEHGVRPGDRVGLWLPKSLDAVIALWGTLKAGAAYVPIDPGAPSARMAFIARDCSIAALVTRADRAAAVAEAFGTDPPMGAVWLADGSAAEARVAGRPVVPWASLESLPASAPDVPLTRDALAYILYTSGSTGDPKGVVHTHGSALAFVEWAARTFAVAPDDRLANHAPFHFDLSTFDLFAGACAGAAVYPVPARANAFPAAITKLYVSERLTIWYETPSSLALMLSRGGLASLDLSALRVLLFAGEVMPVKTLRELMRLAPHARFANLYGPTETNVCTWHEVTSPPAEDRSLPIGMASSGDHLLVLDDSLTPVPRGGAGELWVHGRSVMRGYWGDPQRTAETLRTLDVAGSGPVLAYRTGDLVCEGADGALEFLGRRDHQVKTRGYRVELGEIETVLQRHGSVAEAVALALPDPEITNRLVAVVVAAAGAAVDEASLKEHCAGALPRYMVPERIAFRDKLPRTSSGKVDRRALAAETESERGPA
jgi:amino acid adenylation domain-containing protein